MKLRLFTGLQLFLLVMVCKAFTPDSPVKPSGLTVNLLTCAGKVSLNGYHTNVTLKDAVARKESFQFARLCGDKPFFGWTVNSESSNARQTAYRILVASSWENILKDTGDLWDSGKAESALSANIPYEGKKVKSGIPCYWKVKTWDNQGGISGFSDISQFMYPDESCESISSVYPLQKQDEFPVAIKKAENSVTFLDFGRAGFGRLRVTLEGKSENDTIVIHLGEKLKEGRIDRNPGGTIRYSSYELPLKRGNQTYVVTLRPDVRNTGPKAVRIPEYIGEVTPFRYCEIENYSGKIEKNQVVRETVFYPFNENESWFLSSDTVLNRIWDLCKYSIKATSFAGIYVDGDRERIPYEADAYINQLSHYGVAKEYTLARKTMEYLLHNPTWPTEWILQTLLMAWEDYMYTGNPDFIHRYYEDLKAKTLVALADEQGFISTKTGQVTPEILKSIHFDEELKDIVDWPHTGILGLGKNEKGETDGFVFSEINTVVNAFHYRALVLMGKMAGMTGKGSDEKFFTTQAAKLKESFNTLLLDKKRGIYRDGTGTDHASLHGNMFPLAFGLIPEKNLPKVMEFIKSRGMACSVYGAQFLLDAVYEAGDGAYGLQLMGSTSERSWYNMIRVGSTISLEAWENKYKPNQDWNHAWGAAPANLIPRKLMGIEPLDPGFGKIRIKPQPASLEWAEIQVPTIRGSIFMSFRNKPGSSFSMKINIPANTTAEVWLPFWTSKQKVILDGTEIPCRKNGKYVVTEEIGSGEKQIELLN